MNTNYLACLYSVYLIPIFQDFVNAANCYEQLTLLYPDNEDYKIYYAQALYQACLYEEAMKVTVQIENPELQGKVGVINALDFKVWLSSSCLPLAFEF